MRKGQAAMEFLMTYGWAILVVLAAIGALTYFNVLDLSKLAPEQCNFGTTFGVCDDAQVTAADNTITVVLKNNLPNAIEYFALTNFTSEDCNVQSITPSEVTNVVEQGRSIGTFKVVCSNDLQKGDVIRGTFVAKYRKQGGALNQTAEGEFLGKAQ